MLPMRMTTQFGFIGMCGCTDERHVRLGHVSHGEPHSTESARLRTRAPVLGKAEALIGRYLTNEARADLCAGLHDNAGAALR